MSRRSTPSFAVAGCQQAEVDRIKSAALSFIDDVQTHLLSCDENLRAFPLGSLETLVDLLRLAGTSRRA